MIAIYTTDGTELQLKSGSVFTINWISTAFNDSDDFLGSYSYPVALAYCPSNNIALGMANQLENRSARQDITVLVRIFGIHWKKCTLSFTIDTDSYSAFLKIDNGAFGNIIKNKLLTDIFVTTDSKGKFVDFVYKQLTFNLADTNAYIQKCIHDTTGNYPVYFFPVLNKFLFGDSAVEGDPGYDDQYHLVNPWSSGIGFIFDIADHAARALFYTPFFNLVYVVTQVLNYLGYQPAGDFFTDPLIRDKVIYNTGFLNSLDIISNGGLKLAPARHLPNITLGDLFKKLRTQFKLAIYFDADLGKCTMNIVRNTLKSRERVDISGSVSPKYSIKSSLTTGYELVQPVDDGDNTFKNLTYDKSFFIGDTFSPSSIDGFIPTLFTQIKKNPLSPGGNTTFRVPVAEQLGNGYSLCTQNAADSYNKPGTYNKNDFGLRLLTYRGLHSDSEGFDYPYGTGDDQNALSPAVPDDVQSVLDANSDYALSLWLGGTRGILAVYNFDWYNFFLRTELVELDAYLPMRMLQQVTPLGLMEFRTPSQAIIPAMLNDMIFEASQNERLLQSKMRVYPIYSQKDIDKKAINTFTPSQQVNPGGIYVKLTIVDDPTQTTYFTVKGKKTAKDCYVIATLSFFSDEAGTIPKEVSNLWVYMNSNLTTIRPGHSTTINTHFRETASGSVYQLPDVIQTQEYEGLGGDVTYMFNVTRYNLQNDPKILAGADYKIIGDIYGGYVKPA